MFNDGIMPEWEFEKLCQQFYPHYINCYGFDKDLWKKFGELFMEEIKEQKKDTIKSTTKKSNTQENVNPIKKSTKANNTNEHENDEKETSTDFLQTIFDILKEISSDAPKGKHEKSESAKTSPDIKNHIDKKSNVNIADKSKIQHTEGDKGKMKTIIITLTSGKTVTWTSDNYDSYKLIDGCFVIVKNGVYVGIYNMRYVTSVVVN